MTRNIRTSVRWFSVRAVFLVPSLMIFHACTNLTEVPRDALTPTNAFHTDAEIVAGVASVYAGFRGLEFEVYNMQEVSTDEVIVPTRGQDWYDNGRWLEIYKHTWGSNSGSTQADGNTAWNNLFSGVARANLMIDVITKAGGANGAAYIAELRTLRAWYYYLLMDMFGGVPLVTTPSVQPVARASRDSVFRFIEAELKAARPLLPAKRPSDQTGRVTQGAADAILASLYLNAQVYTGTVSAAGLAKGTARWSDAIAAADAVINSGNYSLTPNWKKNFSTDNHDSPENIFIIAHTGSIAGLGMTIPMRTLHYNQLTPGPWNGFATIAETYNAFDPADARLPASWLAGQQYNFNTGALVNDRAGKPLVFTVDIANETQASEGEGPRLGKFPPLPGALDGNSHPNNFPWFRLAEMYLIKAEAMNELGQTANAIAQVNLVRARHFSPAKPLDASMSQGAARTAIFQERLFELSQEAKRRSDMVRAGTFDAARRFKAATGAFKMLYPIPQAQIDVNPLLTQNPGY